MIDPPLLFAAAAATAALSATVGMAGGLLLMGFYAGILPIPEAMVLHGFTQLVANGGRAVVQRRHVAWGPLRMYAGGAFAAWLAFAYVSWTPDARVVYIGLGLLPFVAHFSHLRADFLRPRVAAFAGVAVTGVQLLFGVAGPLLDLFFLHGPLDRHGVVATKAVTQTLAHALKIAAFLPLVADLHAEAIAVASVGAVVGTIAGSQLLERIPEAAFRRGTKGIVMGIGGYYLLKGVI